MRFPASAAGVLALVLIVLAGCGGGIGDSPAYDLYVIDHGKGNASEQALRPYENALAKIHAWCGAKSEGDLADYTAVVVNKVKSDTGQTVTSLYVLRIVAGAIAKGVAIRDCTLLFSVTGLFIESQTT